MSKTAARSRGAFGLRGKRNCEAALGHAHRHCGRAAINRNTAKTRPRMRGHFHRIESEPRKPRALNQVRWKKCDGTPVPLAPCNRDAPRAPQSASPL